MEVEIMEVEDAAVVESSIDVVVSTGSVVHFGQIEK
jgi:hypothetical protein